jgi:hypothetical protein
LASSVVLAFSQTSLDKLLAAHATGTDARLDHLVERYGGDVVPASSKLAPANVVDLVQTGVDAPKTPENERTESPRSASSPLG